MTHTPLHIGAARFTFFEPCVIRLEYAEDEVFTDVPTLFAAARPSVGLDVEFRKEKQTHVLESERLRLEYTEDGKPFHEGNLCITLKTKHPVTWHPGQKQTGNLKGPLQTLDGVRGPVPMPDGLLSRDGWFFQDDSRGPLLEGNWIRPRPAVPLNPTESNSYRVEYRQDGYFFGYGSDYQSALDGLVAISGPVPLPRRTAMGSWYCRWYPFTSDEYRSLVREYKEQDCPLDILVFDMDWHRLNATAGLGMQDLTLGWTGYSWNRDLLPDAEALVAELKADDLQIVLNDHPHDGLRSHEDRYTAFMEAMGEKADGRNLPFDAGDARYWKIFWEHSHRPFEKDGVDFWWLDWQQDDILPYIPGLGKQPHLPWLNQLYVEESRSGGRRGQGFSRWGGTGDHRHPMHFSGDIESNWEAFKFEIEFTVRSGNSGCFFWSHDIGGFYGKPDAELYARWMQFGALSASLRLHSCGPVDRRPWTWEAPYAEALIEAMQFRARLMPSIYTAAWQSATLNRPLLRPMYLEWPELDAAYEYLNQYLLGDHLLAAPVTEAADPETGLAEGRCWLPPGEWIDWWTGESHQGNRVIANGYGLRQFPLFVRAGAVIPLREPSLRPASAPIQEIELRCFPANDNTEPVSSWYYDDDGLSSLPTDSHLSKFKLSGRTLTLRPARADFKWREKRPTLRISTHQFHSEYKLERYPDTEFHHSLSKEKPSC